MKPVLMEVPGAYMLEEISVNEILKAFRHWLDSKNIKYIPTKIYMNKEDAVTLTKEINSLKVYITSGFIKYELEIKVDEKIEKNRISILC